MTEKNNSFVKGVLSGLVVSAVVAFSGSAMAATKVDEKIYNGWKTYTRERCETCHGQTAEGSAAFPNLVEKLKTSTKEQFVEIVTNGKGGMPAHKDRAKVMENMDALYAFLKGRSDGSVPAGDLEK